HGLVLEQSLFCLEPTGHYFFAALDVLVALKIPIWAAHPFHIKQTSSDKRGKCDELDAIRIAQYAYRYQDQARLFTTDQIKLTGLKQLIMKREQLLRRTFDSVDRAVNKTLDKQLARVDKMIEEWLDTQPDFQEQYDLICSIPGVGKVLATNLLAVTDGFTRFTDPKALACHCGVAPFEHTSGTTIKARARTSPRSNSTLRSLLHMASLGAIRHDPGLKAYYERKVAQGKAKMSVLNAVRGKLIDRVFAVLKRKEAYSKEPLAFVIE
ncbi:MAG: transposase, partial [Bacteroidota bacterium]|nr:transposase [Bacteroidota bacterium]